MKQMKQAMRLYTTAIRQIPNGQGLHTYYDTYKHTYMHTNTQPHQYTAYIQVYTDAMDSLEAV